MEREGLRKDYISKDAISRQINQIEHQLNMKEEDTRSKLLREFGKLKAKETKLDERLERVTTMELAVAKQSSD